MEQHDDVFISYRRDGGEALACLLAERLMRLGYRVFYDVESLRSGKFNKKIYEVIENCKDVIVVLPQGGLDKCTDEEDWVRKEIIHGIRNQKNIVPVMMRNFKWPNRLPDEMKSLPDYQGVSADMEYFEAVFNKLLGLLHSTVDRSFVNKEYDLMYHSFSPYLGRKRITSRIVVDQTGHASLYSNIKNNDIQTADYQYYGIAMETDQNIYLYLDNDSSQEKLVIVLFKGAGSFDRYIGILNGLSSAMLPVSFKCVCLLHSDADRIREDLLEVVLQHNNKEWNNNVLAVESSQIHLFFSEDFLTEE